MAKNIIHRLVGYPFAYRRATYFRDLISPHIRDYSSLLDVGCGNMLIAKFLSEKANIPVQGIDVIDMNLANLPHSLFDGENVPFRDNEFELSLLISVLHHAKKPRKLLKEVKRVTSGRIIVFEDIYYSAVGKYWIKIIDVLGNSLEEWNMNFTSNFRKDSDWEKEFSRISLKIKQKMVVWNRLRLTHHVLFVLDVSN